MKLFERRLPIGWPLVVVATFFGALGVYALCTGDLFILGGKGRASRHLLREAQPEQFLFHVRFYFAAAGVLYLLGCARLALVEDGFRRLRALGARKIRQKGDDRRPVPWWGYVFFAGFVAVVLWIGKVTMYAD